MKLRHVAILLAFPLGACGSYKDSNALDTTTGIIETPLYIAFKIPTCLGLAPLTAPGAIASAIVPFKDQSKGSGVELHKNAFIDACGPPYVAQPHYGMKQP